MTSAKTLASVTEQTLIAECLAGDQRAWTKLQTSYEPFVRRICRKVIGKRDPEYVDDLVQEAFLKIFQKLATFRGESDLRTWIYILSYRMCLMHLRTLKRQPEHISLESLTYPDSGKPWDMGADDRWLEAVPTRLELANAISELPPGYRTIFELHDVQGLQHKEVAVLTGKTIGCSKSQLSKSREALRKKLTSDKS